MHFILKNVKGRLRKLRIYKYLLFALKKNKNKNNNKINKTVL